MIEVTVRISIVNRRLRMMLLEERTVPITAIEVQASTFLRRAVRDFNRGRGNLRTVSAEGESAKRMAKEVFGK